jgi:hypothetical protein
MSEVVDDPTDALPDIPALMEGVAADIRRGDLSAHSAVCVVLAESGAVTVFGWGSPDDVHSIGVLQLGAVWLSNQKAD